jgi:hypothetical protein
MLERIKESIQSLISAHLVSDFDETGHDPLCFDCNDGNDQCVHYPNCQHIQKKMKYYQALGIDFPEKEVN